MIITKLYWNISGSVIGNILHRVECVIVDSNILCIVYIHFNDVIFLISQ